jgi:hypothetical protein
MQKIYEQLRIYEENSADRNLQDINLLIEEQYLLIQHEHPVQKRKIQGELNSVRDRLAVISNKQRQRIQQETEQKNRDALFKDADHTGIQMQDLQMDYAHAQVDQMLHQGSKYRSELSSQNQMMRKMKNKVLTSLSTLGISQSLIAKINTRLSSDLWLFFAIVYLFITYVF